MCLASFLFQSPQLGCWHTGLVCVQTFLHFFSEHQTLQWQSSHSSFKLDLIDEGTHIKKYTWCHLFLTRGTEEATVALEWLRGSKQVWFAFKGWVFSYLSLPLLIAAIICTVQKKSLSLTLSLKKYLRWQRRLPSWPRPGLSQRICSTLTDTQFHKLTRSDKVFCPNHPPDLNHHHYPCIDLI